MLWAIRLDGGLNSDAPVLSKTINMHSKAWRTESLSEVFSKFQHICTHSLFLHKPSVSTGTVMFREMHLAAAH